MKSNNLIKDKSFRFAVRIVKFYKHLNSVKHEYVLAKQILRSGTSIGANIREAYNAESAMDFIHKLGIAQKETDETLYWLELFLATEFIENNEFESLSFDCTELLKITKSIILTKKLNIQKANNKKLHSS